MRIRVEAQSAEEVRRKAPEMLRRLEASLRSAAPEAADALQKASAALLPEQEPILKHRALQDGLRTVQLAYARQLAAMLDEIGEYLDAHVDGMGKSESPDYTSGIVSLEAANFERAKEALRARGFTDADFEDGGKLAGMSANEMRELLKEMRTA